MPLPPLLEICPLAAPCQAALTVPGSKSITNRALVLAALAEGTTVLRGALWSDDTQVMVQALQTLGYAVEVAPDPLESANRRLIVAGRGARVPEGGRRESPRELFVGNAGTAARFLAAMLCLGRGVYRLHGEPRMHERPQAALFGALRQLGYQIESESDRLPALIHGGGPRAAACTVNITESSQFASALILSAQAGGWRVEIRGENAEESPYVAMARKLCAQFPAQGGRFELQVEPDASSGSYFWAADFLQRLAGHPPGSIVVNHWPATGWQVDARFPGCWPLPETLSRQSGLGDSIMTAIVLAPFAGAPRRFTDLGRLRVQECERVQALRTELGRCGARVEEAGDTLTVFPGPLHGAEIATYQDHRVAMCFAILGLKVPGIRLQNPACVKKTFPNFFQKLAAPPPQGLGAVLLEAPAGRPLAEAELFAD